MLVSRLSHHKWHQFGSRVLNTEQYDFEKSRRTTMCAARLPRNAKTAALTAIKDKPKSRMQPLTATLKSAKSTVTTGAIAKKTGNSKRQSTNKADLILKKEDTLDSLNTVPLSTNGVLNSLQDDVAGVSYSSGDITDEAPPPDRPANPHTTNVALKRSTSPEEAAIAVPNSASPNTTDASQFLIEGIKHITSVDPALKPLIDKHFCHVFSNEGLNEVVDPFRSLVSGILAQQVSGAAAKAIKNKFIALWDPPVAFPTPQQCVDMPLETMRTAGLSQRKAEYVKGLAEKFVSKELSSEVLLTGSDEELVDKLVAVRGIGQWSAEMFLCFALKRGDILSTTDLGVQRGMAIQAGRDVAKLKFAKTKGKYKYMNEVDMLEMAEKYRPYRSIYMWYMWRIGETDVQVMTT